MNRVTMNFTVQAFMVASLLGWWPLHVSAQVVSSPSQTSDVINNKPRRKHELKMDSVARAYGRWAGWRESQTANSMGQIKKYRLVGRIAGRRICNSNRVWQSTVRAVGSQDGSKEPKPVVNDERAKTIPDEFFYQFVVSSYERGSGRRYGSKLSSRMSRMKASTKRIPMRLVLR